MLSCSGCAMLKSKSRSATYADIEALPSNMVGEIIFGVLHAHPRPAPRHAVAANAVGSEVSTPFQFGRGGPGGWLFMVEPELHLGPHVVVPDVAGWKRERLTPFPATAYIETPPDWLCEVLSPSTQAIDRTDKLTVYAEFGRQALLVRRSDRAHAGSAGVDGRQVDNRRHFQERRSGDGAAIRGAYVRARRAVGGRGAAGGVSSHPLSRTLMHETGSS